MEVTYCIDGRCLCKQFTVADSESRTCECGHGIERHATDYDS